MMAIPNSSTWKKKPGVMKPKSQTTPTMKTQRLQLLVQIIHKLSLKLRIMLSLVTLNPSSKSYYSTLAKDASSSSKLKNSRPTIFQMHTTLKNENLKTVKFVPIENIQSNSNIIGSHSIYEIKHYDDYSLNLKARIGPDGNENLITGENSDWLLHVQTGWNVHISVDFCDKLLVHLKDWRKNRVSPNRGKLPEISTSYTLQKVKTLVKFSGFFWQQLMVW